MESKEQEEKCSGSKTRGQETLALDRKRSKSRRVSFAETTSIHLFIRDEECETPPEVEGEGFGKLSRSESDELRDLLANDVVDDDDDDDNDEQSGLESSFLRPFESPSSGSRFGSATSNDEDNFFGPVSADFIKPGRLSDSAVSEDNHDVTMDSTAFSMHFRSLARSESGGEFKTPTGTHVRSSERSLDQTSTTSGDLMSLTYSRKRVAGSTFRADTISDSGNSDDMSVVVENPRRYDYGELPPELDVLLVKDGKDKGVSLTSRVECEKSSKFVEERDGGSNRSGCELLDISNRDIDAHIVSDVNKNSEVYIDNLSANDPTKPPILETIVVRNDNDKEASKGATESTRSSPQSNSQYNLIQSHPIANSFSSLFLKSPQIFSPSPKYKSNRILSEKKLSDNTSKQVLSASSFEKSVSRLKRFEAFPFGSTSKVESNPSRLIPSESLIQLKRNHLTNEVSKDDLINQFSVPVACLDKRFSYVTEDNHEIQSVVNRDFPLTKTERNVSASPLYQGSLFKKPNEEKGSILRVGQEFLEEEENAIASRFENSSSLYTKKSLEVERASPNERCFESALIEKESDSSKVVVPGSNVENGLVFSRALPVISMKPVIGSSPTPDNNQNEFPVQVSYDANADAFVGKTVSTPKSFQLSSKQIEKNQLLQKSPNINGNDHSSTLKRKLFNEVQDCIDDVASSLCMSKVRKEQKHSEGGSNVPHNIGVDLTIRDWIEVFERFSGMTGILPPSIHKLDLSQIRMLRDNLAHLEKMTNYELLHSDMCSQRAFDATHRLKMKRVVDAKLLLYRNLYEKAKLQLMNLEREKLLDQVRQLNSRIEESKNLISRVQSQKDVEIDVIASCPIDRSGMCLGVVDVPSLRQELVSSERKIRNLQDHFHDYAKVMKGLTHTELTVHVRNFLRNRVACRSLRSEIQLCQVGSVQVRDGKPNILVDYDGIMTQRFIVKSLSASDLYVSSMLNDVKISKMFQVMNACDAFSFVLCGESHLSYSGFGSLARQIQRSTSLLHNLLDVVDEVELAISELRNITNVSFLRPSGGKLDLQLSFTDFRGTAKVVLSIDIACLQWGIYPSEILPYDIKGTSTKRQKPFQSLVDDIKTAMNGVKFGYRRILRLCQCVSRVIRVYSSTSSYVDNPTL